MEPRSEPSRRRVQVHVARNDPRVDVVISLLNLELQQRRFEKFGRMRQPLEIGDEDQLYGGFGIDASLPGSQSPESEILRENSRKPIVDGVV